MPRLFRSPLNLEEHRASFDAMVKTSLENPKLFLIQIKTVEKLSTLLKNNVLAFLTTRNAERKTNRADKVDHYCWALAQPLIIGLSKQHSKLFQRFIAQETRAERLIITKSPDGKYTVEHPLTGSITAFAEALQNGWEIEDFGPYPAPHAFLQRGKEHWKTYEAPATIDTPSLASP